MNSHIVDERPPSKRIISFDFIRGVAMIGVLGFHLLSVTYDVGKRFDLGIENLPIPYIILIIILGFMGSLVPTFILISAIGNTMSMSKKWAKLTQDGSPEALQGAYKSIMKMQLIRGCFLIVFDKMCEILLNGWLMLSLIPETGDEIRDKMLSELYHMQIIGLVGWGVILTSLIFLNMKKKGKPQKTIIIVLIGVGLLVIALSPVMNYVFEMIPGLKGYPNRTLEDRGFFLNVVYIIISPLANGWYPIFPAVASFFFGVALGLEFAEGNFSKKFLYKMLIASVGILILGLLVYFIPENDHYTDYLNDMLIPLSGSLVLLVIVVYFVEVQGKGTNFGRKTTFFRRFGSLSLTVWGMQWTMVLYLKLVNLILYGTSMIFIDSPLYNRGMTGWETWGLFFGVLPLWFLFLRVWEMGNYAGSFEWIFGKLASQGARKGKGTNTNQTMQSAKSNIAFGLHNVVSVIDEADGKRYFNTLELIGIFFLLLVNMIASLVPLFF
ncbi:MAG: hypothetical protein ACTSRK_00105 [Promethearchaeota archaeon]